MPLSPGARLGHYHVTSLLGEGGTGQVWQATDTQLGRQVALKILPDAFADDPDRLARFQREAQILASLNHPNIAAIHGIEQSDDTRALVLELVEGPTLADRIAKGPDLSQSPTMTATVGGTHEGVILGTAAYMSPEQASGTRVDKRADIWSFGVVLFEMLTGRRAFDGETVSHALAAVLKTEPDWTALPAETPAAIDKLLRRCLVKERRGRVPDIGMARIEIDDAFRAPATEGTHAVALPQLRLWQRPIPLAAGMATLLVITGFTVWSATRPGPPPQAPLEQFVINTPPGGAVTSARVYPEVAMSSDGSHVAYESGIGFTFRTSRASPKSGCDHSPPRPAKAAALNADGSHDPRRRHDARSV